MNTSIKWKIISIFVSIQIIVLSGIGLYLSSYLKNFIYQQMDTNMLKQVNLISELILSDLKTGDYKNLQQKSVQMAEDIEGRITIIANSGKVLADTEENPDKMENHADRPEIIDAKAKGVGLSTRHSTTLNIDMKYLARRLEPYGYIRLAIPITDVNKTLLQIFSQLIVGFILAFILFSILAWKVSVSITDPIKKITITAQKIANGKLSERIHIYTKDEIGTLSRMFNLMAHQLEDIIKKITGEKERLVTILENMADGLIALDKEKRVILINRAAGGIFGFKENVCEGKSLIEITRNQKITEAVQRVYQVKENISAEIQLHFPKEVILRTQLAPILREGEVYGLVMIFTDITELRRLEHLRTEFVGNVSHELKTPLTSIKGYVETLLDMDDFEPPVIKRFLGIINRESERLSHLIDDLLDLSRLEGKNHHQLIPTLLGPIVREALEVLKPRAEKKKINLKLIIQPDIPEIIGVEEQINQVIINLVDNAIKYTPDGGEVIITLDKEDEWVVLKVSDNGIGIPLKDLDRIFERFYRVDKARSRQMGGTGLGLSIVKHIVKAHNGEIKVESQVGVGTTFIVKFRPAF